MRLLVRVSGVMWVLAMVASMTSKAFAGTMVEYGNDGSLTQTILALLKALISATGLSH